MLAPSDLFAVMTPLIDAQRLAFGRKTVTVADDVAARMAGGRHRSETDLMSRNRRIVDCYTVTSVPCRPDYRETPGRSRPDEPRGAREVPRGRARRTQDRLHLHARLDALSALTRDHERDRQPRPSRRPANRHHVDRSASAGHTLAGRDVVRLRRRSPAHCRSRKRQAIPRSAPDGTAANVAFYPVEPVGVGLALRRTQQLQSLARKQTAPPWSTRTISRWHETAGERTVVVLPARLLLHQYDVRRPGAPDQRQGCEARRRGQCKTDVSRTHCQ